MTWVLDKTRSSVEFAVRHLQVSVVRGHFTDFDAEVSIDLENPQSSFVHASIRAASVDTGNVERDKQLRSPDIFDVERFPLIEFRSTDAIRLGTHTFWLRGDLTIHGTSHEVTLEGEVHEEPTGEDRRRTATLTVRADVDRNDFFKIPGLAGDLLIGRTVTLVVIACLEDAPDNSASVATPESEGMNREGSGRG